jgi:DNA-directed RNA polymerase subunit RPC12/RpoP
VKEPEVFQDKVLTCSDCGKEFIWEAEEQEYFRQQGFDPPKRCQDCRPANKHLRAERDARKSDGN